MARKTRSTPSIQLAANSTASSVNRNAKPATYPQISPTRLIFFGGLLWRRRPCSIGVIADVVKLCKSKTAVAPPSASLLPRRWRRYRSSSERIFINHCEILTRHGCHVNLFGGGIYGDRVRAISSIHGGDYRIERPIDHGYVVTVGVRHVDPVGRRVECKGLRMLAHAYSCEDRVGGSINYGYAVAPVIRRIDSVRGLIHSDRARNLARVNRRHGIALFVDRPHFRAAGAGQVDSLSHDVRRDPPNVCIHIDGCYGVCPALALCA